MTNPELLNSDSAEIAQLLIQIIGSCFMAYVLPLLGLELGGRMQGYPGRGFETHEQIMKALFHKDD